VYSAFTSDLTQNGKISSMENNIIANLETSEDQNPITPWIFVLSWVFAALVSTAITYLAEPYLEQYQYILIVIKAAVIALTQSLVLRDYFKNAWFWALLTFLVYLSLGLTIFLLRSELTSLYTSMSKTSTYIFLFIFDTLVQSIIASVQYLALRKEVAFASRWIVISVFSVFLGLMAQILVVNIVTTFGSPEIFGTYLRLINMSINSLVSYLISGIGMVFLLENKIFSDEMLVKELED